MKGTEEALKMWEKVPHNVRIKILNNVWCSHCKTACGIAKPHAVLKGNDLILEGSCITCHGKVVRLLESL